MQVGEVAAWEKLSAIECNCTIEATLDSCMASISNRVRPVCRVNMSAGWLVFGGKQACRGMQVSMLRGQHRQHWQGLKAVKESTPRRTSIWYTNL